MLFHCEVCPSVPPPPHLANSAVDLQLRDGLCSVSEERVGRWGAGVISYWAMLQINVWINYLINEQQDWNRWRKANIWTLSSCRGEKKDSRGKKKRTYVLFSARKFLISKTEKAFKKKAKKKTQVAFKAKFQEQTCVSCEKWQKWATSLQFYF